MGAPIPEKNEKQIMSERQENQTPKKTNYLVLGMSLGMTFGVALGIVFGVALDNMGFMSIGIAIGLSMGVAIGAALDQRHKQDNA